jgi:uncharacterized membrane protein YfcA
MDDSALKSPEILDKAAVALSGLCLLHCLALPLVVVLLPILNEVGIEQWHAPMLLVVIPVSVVAFWLGLRRHHDRRILGTGILGMTLMVIGGTVAHYLVGLTADRVLTLGGAVILAAAHYRNSRLARHPRRR